MWAFTGGWSTHQGYTLRENCLPFVAANIANSSTARDGNVCSVPSPCWDLIWPVLAQVFMCSVTTTMNSDVPLPCFVHKRVLLCGQPPSLASTLFPPPFHTDSPHGRGAVYMPPSLPH